MHKMSYICALPIAGLRIAAGISLPLMRTIFSAMALVKAYVFGHGSINLKKKKSDNVVVFVTRL